MAITVTRKRANVDGSRRSYYLTLNCGNGDALTINGLKFIEAWGGTTTSTDAVGGTVSGNVITLATPGAETGVLLWASGY